MKYLSIVVCLVMALFTVSCEKQELIERESNSHTLFVFMPTTLGGGDLTEDLLTNIEHMKLGLTEEDMAHARLVVCMENPLNVVRMFEIRRDAQGAVREYTLATYNNPQFTTVDGLKRMFGLLRQFSPSSTYSMIVGSHGMGWLYATELTARSGEKDFNYHYVNGKKRPLTRYFGGGVGRQINIETLRQALEESNLHMNHILFDDCYMATVEVAYELRHVTDYLIACPTEIMAYGMPYELIISNLIREENYEKLVNTFIGFYRDYRHGGTPFPYATIGVIRTSELDELARLMKEINTRYVFDPEQVGNIQVMDGYSKTYFFDMGDYVHHLCQDSELWQRFDAQLKKTVPFKGHTDAFFSAERYYYGLGPVPVHTYSGITISAPSQHPRVLETYDRTAWYQATQNR